MRITYTYIYIYIYDLSIRNFSQMSCINRDINMDVFKKTNKMFIIIFMFNQALAGPFLDCTCLFLR